MGYVDNYNQRMNETYFCWQVAYTNKLELLKWIREEKKCEWMQGRLMWPQNKAIWKWSSIAWQMSVLSIRMRVHVLPENGHLECLKYLHEEVKAPWDSRYCLLGGSNGHLHILEYLVERKYDKYDEDACADAARYGQLDCLKYLRETAKAPWDRMAVRCCAREQPPRMCTIPPRQ